LKHLATTTALAVAAALLAATGASGQDTPPVTAAPAFGPDHDFNGDGLQDLLAVRELDGHLLFHAGRGDGTFEDPVSLGSGWRAVDVAMAGDLTSDGRADMIARDTATGFLYTYPGDGQGGFEPRIKVGFGWKTMGAFTSGRAFDYDLVNDLIAVDERDGKLYYYPGLGDGSFGPRTEVRSTGSGLREDWRGVDNLTTYEDGYSWMLLARDGVMGDYRAYRYASGALSSWDFGIDPSLGGGSRAFGQVVGAGDLDGDHNEDLLALQPVDGGRLWMIAFNYYHEQWFLHSGKIVGEGWNGNRLPTAYVERTYDFDSDGAQDVAARRSADGRMYVYRGDGTGGFAHPLQGYPGWDEMVLIETAGDFDGDGRADVLAREASSGMLYLHEGNGRGLLAFPGSVIGRGWDAMSAIVSGHDYDLDGNVDVLAREGSTGVLWLYPGTGYGTLGDRVQIGTGWNGMRHLTGVGDLDHDGVPDLLAVRDSDDCLYFYGGRGTGTFASPVRIGCGWDVMNRIAAVGDFDGDGDTDWIARLAADGRLFLYRGDGSGGYRSSGVIGTGWSGMTIA
jgi:hypothetical protein